MKAEICIKFDKNNSKGEFYSACIKDEFSCEMDAVLTALMKITMLRIDNPDWDFMYCKVYKIVNKATNFKLLDIITM